MRTLQQPFIEQALGGVREVGKDMTDIINEIHGMIDEPALSLTRMKGKLLMTTASLGGPVWDLMQLRFKDRSFVLQHGDDTLVGISQPPWLPGIWLPPWLPPDFPPPPPPPDPPPPTGIGGIRNQPYPIPWEYPKDTPLVPQQARAMMQNPAKSEPAWDNPPFIWYKLRCTPPSIDWLQPFDTPVGTMRFFDLEKLFAATWTDPDGNVYNPDLWLHVSMWDLVRITWTAPWLRIFGYGPDVWGELRSGQVMPLGFWGYSPLGLTNMHFFALFDHAPVKGEVLTDHVNFDVVTPYGELKRNPDNAPIQTQLTATLRIAYPDIDFGGSWDFDNIIMDDPTNVTILASIKNSGDPGSVLHWLSSFGGGAPIQSKLSASIDHGALNRGDSSPVSLTLAQSGVGLIAGMPYAASILVTDSVLTDLPPRTRTISVDVIGGPDVTLTGPLTTYEGVVGDTQTETLNALIRNTGYNPSILRWGRTLTLDAALTGKVTATPATGTLNFNDTQVLPVVLDHTGVTAGTHMGTLEVSDSLIPSRTASLPISVLVRDWPSGFPASIACNYYVPGNIPIVCSQAATVGNYNSAYATPHFRRVGGKWQVWSAFLLTPSSAGWIDCPMGWVPAPGAHAGHWSAKAWIVFYSYSFGHNITIVVTQDGSCPLGV
jgi:hypothetical protein